MAVRAPHFPKDLKWFNRPQQELLKLQGKFLLLEFFTFGCINCINNLQSIKKIHQAYGDNLHLVGVHVGKFAHEKEDHALESALKRLDVNFAVINDAEHQLSDAYAAKGWPTTILIDERGYIVEHLSGECSVEALEDLLSSYDVKKGLLEREQEKHQHKLHFPTKVMVSEQFLAVANTEAHEVWLSDLEGKVSDVISADRPMGLCLHEEKLYICERDSLTLYDLKNREKRVLLQGLRNPYAVVVQEGTLMVALAGAHLIEVYELQSMRLIEHYGNRFEALRDGDAQSCQLAQTSGLVMMDEILYFVDAESSSLRKIERGRVETLIGEGLFSYGDQNEGKLLLQHPEDLCAGIIGDGCGGGRLFIADTFNNKVKAFYPEDGSMMTLLEDLDEPRGIAKKGCELYIANTNAHEIVVFDLSKMQKRVIVFCFDEVLSRF